MLKSYQFRTHCKGDSHSSKTANIIARTHDKTKVNVLTAASERNIVGLALRLLNLGEMTCFNQI